MHRRHDAELVLVLGSHGSCAGLLRDVLEQLGFHALDSSAVTDLHARALQRAIVQSNDARPVAWARCAQVGARRDARRSARRLIGDFGFSRPRLAVTDPNLHWFYPMWRDTACEQGTRTSVVTVLQHPAYVTAPPTTGSSNSLVAGWLNNSLYAERATRDGPRAFVTAEAIVADWTVVASDIAESLGVDLLVSGDSGALARASHLVDSIRQPTEPEWPVDGLDPAVRDLAERTWAALEVLPKDPADSDALRELDRCRSRYLELYRVAEELTSSSVTAGIEHAWGARKPMQRLLATVWRIEPRIPKHWRDRIPEAIADLLRDSR